MTTRTAKPPFDISKFSAYVAVTAAIFGAAGVAHSTIESARKVGEIEKTLVSHQALPGHPPGHDTLTEVKDIVTDLKDQVTEMRTDLRWMKERLK